MSQPTICPNCGQHDVQTHPDDGCILAALIQVVRERGNLTAEQAIQLHANCDADALWSAVGPVVDCLEAGQFNAEVTQNG